MKNLIKVFVLSLALAIGSTGLIIPTVACAQSTYELEQRIEELERKLKYSELPHGGMRAMRWDKTCRDQKYKRRSAAIKKYTHIPVAVEDELSCFDYDCLYSNMAKLAETPEAETKDERSYRCRTHVTAPFYSISDINFSYSERECKKGNPDWQKIQTRVQALMNFKKYNVMDCTKYLEKYPEYTGMFYDDK